LPLASVVAVATALPTWAPFASIWMRVTDTPATGDVPLIAAFAGPPIRNASKRSVSVGPLNAIEPEGADTVPVIVTAGLPPPPPPHPASIAVATTSIFRE